MSAISKADALETFADLYDVFEDNKAIRKELDKVYDRLNALPSAQPEIIQCKDCKHRGEAPNADGMYWCEIHDTFMYYCSDAERRETSNDKTGSY